MGEKSTKEGKEGEKEVSKAGINEGKRKKKMGGGRKEGSKV